MSTQQHVSSIAGYKRNALLKYCNENGMKLNHLEAILNKLHQLGFLRFLIRLI